MSMLQRVWRQLEMVGLTEDTYICASKAQRDMIESQVGSISFIEEPSRRDTFPAIALAVTYLADIEDCSDDEVVAVCPIDHFVDDEYFWQISTLDQVLGDAGTKLALMGVTPSEATSKFGYIRLRADETGRSWNMVEGFVEKPKPETAAQLIAEGALWNCGVFCFELGYVRDILKDKGYPADYEGLSEAFFALPKRSFDYEVVENTDSIAVRPYDGMWQDLGTWEALSKQLGQTFVGKGMAKGCENTHVINELGIPVIAMGLKNAIVVTTPDGILVSDKETSSSVKDAIAPFEGRPMFEERRWGSYRVLDYQKLADGTEVLTKSIELHPGHNISYQKHLKRSEVWTIIEGSGEIALDSRIQSIAPGDVIRIHPDQWHAIRAHERMMFIEVQRGSELIEEDIVRRYLSWAEVQAHCSVVSV